MTGTQLIIPLEDDTDNSADGGNNISSHRMNQVADSVVLAPTFTLKGSSREDNNNLPSSSSSNVLSDELREQFETMKSVWRQVKRASSGEVDMQDEQLPLQDLKRKERKMAVETAFAVDHEISRWKNGIAELEAMLAAEEENSLGSSYSDDDGDDDDALDTKPAGNQGQNVLMMHQDHRRGNAPHLQPHPRLGFPCLPPIVPNEDVDDISAGP